MTKDQELAVRELYDWANAVGDCMPDDTGDFVCNSWDQIESALKTVCVMLFKRRKEN